MTPKQFAVLAATAGLSLIVAIAIYTARADWSAAEAGTARLFPALGGDASRIERVAITQGDAGLILEKAGDRWVLKSQDGFPASTDKVRALVSALTDATLLEPKTRSPARYALLDVDDPAAKATNARLIKLEGADGTVLAEVIAGKSRASRTGGTGAEAAGTYVRRPGEEQSWLASTAVTGSTSLRDWTNPRIFETDGEKVRLVTVELPGEPPYEVKRADDKSHELAAVPAGKKIKYVNMIDNIVEAASFLDFVNVRKATGATGGAAGQVRIETDDGLKVTMAVRRDKDATWATIKATGDGDAKTRAGEIAALAEGWEFEIIPSKADTMLKKHADLLEDIEPATPPGQQGAHPGPGPGPGPALPPGLPPGLPTP